MALWNRGFSLAENYRKVQRLGGKEKFECSSKHFIETPVDGGSGFTCIEVNKTDPAGVTLKGIDALTALTSMKELLKAELSI